MSEQLTRKPTLCLDFDGVIHSYTSGWKGVGQIPDPPTAGFFDWVKEADKYFLLQVYSSRSKEPIGNEAIRRWLIDRWIEASGGTVMSDFGKAGISMHFCSSPIGEPAVHAFNLLISHEKPAAFLTIDDRAWCFDGTWPNPEMLLLYKTWQQMTDEDYIAFRGWIEKPNGDVQITMTREDWESTLLALGSAQGLAIQQRDHELVAWRCAVMNRINVGNPNWIPFELPKDAAK